MQTKASYRKGYLTADFLSQTYRISGDASLRQGVLIDTLNDAMANFVRLENVFISPITEPAELKGNFAVGQVRKENVSLVVISREEDALSRKGTGAGPIKQIAVRVFVTVPGFEIRGGLRVENAVDVERIIMYGADRFIPLYGATATVTTNPAVEFEGGGILVNRDLMGIFCVDKNTG